MHKKLLILAIILLTLSSLSYADSDLAINDFRILLNGEELSAINLNNPVAVTLELDANPFDGYIELNLKELNPGLSTITLDTRNDNDCVLNEDQTKLTCNLDFQLKPINNSVKIYYRFFKGGWSASPLEKTITFQIDEEKPIINDLKTSFCKNDMCYVGRGETNIELEISDNNPLDPSKIFYEIPEFNVVRPAQNCSGNTCFSINQTFNCPNPNGHFHLKLADKSTDAAGNKFENIDESAKLLRCDLEAPKIINFTIIGNGFLERVTDANTAIIDILVRETTTTATAIIDASRITYNSTNFTAACTPVSGESAGIYQKCLVEINDLKAMKNGYFDLYVVDELGNKVSKLSNKIEILHENANLSTEVDFFYAKVTEVKPKIINRAALDLALDNALDYPFHVLYSINNKYSDNAKILLQNLDVGSCRYDFGNGTYVEKPDFFDTVQENIFYPEADYDVANRLDLNFLNPEIDKNRIKVKCNLTFYVEKDNIVYNAPEQEQLSFDINLRNARLDDPGQAFLDKIETTKEDLNSGLMGLIGTLNKLITTMQNVCELTDVMLTIQEHGLSLETLGALMPYGLGQALMQSGNGMWNQVAMVTFTQWVGDKGDLGLNNLASSTDDKIAKKGGGMIRNMCTYVSCDVEKSKDRADDNIAKKLNFAGDEGSFSKLMSSATSNLNQPNPKDSLVASVMEQCWSGVVYNLNKLREIDCGYIYCLKEQATYGNSIAVCEEAKATKTCRFVYGEIFELPFVRVFKNLAANINKIIQEPVMVMSKEWAATACKGKTKTIGPAGMACRLMHTLGVSKDYSFVTEYNQLFTYPTGQDFCEKALCEGDDCDLPTASWLAKALPGTYRDGDTYRAWKKGEKDKKINVANNKDIANFIDNNDGLWKDAEKTVWAKADKNKFEPLAKYFKDNDVPEMEQSKIFDSLKNDDSVRDNVASSLEKGKIFLTNDDMVSSSNNPFLDSNGAVQQNNVNAAKAYTDIMKIDDADRTKYAGFGSKAGCPPKNKGCVDYWTSMGAIKKNGWNLKDGKICRGSGNNEECIDQSKAGTFAKEAIAAQNAPKFYAWFDQVASIVITQLKQKGYLNSLSLSGWGDWGRDLSLQANQLLNPDEWMNSLCNPTGNFKDLTSTDDAVYVMQEEGFRPVLTFATEKLTYDLPDKTTQTLYTTNIIVVSTYEENEAQIFLEPGRFNVSDKISLAKETVVTKAFTKVDTRNFQKVCVEFKQDFPRPGEPKKYCKGISLNAYNRGNVAADNSTLDLEFGVEGSPYSQMSVNTTTQGQFPMGTGFGAGMGGLGN